MIIGYMERLFVSVNILFSVVCFGYFLENINDVMLVVFYDGIYLSMILLFDYKIDMVVI